MSIDFDQRYIDFSLARDYPPAPPEEQPEEMSSMDGVQLAAGPSTTMSDAGGGFGEMKATPRNPVMGGVADFVRGVRNLANQYEIKQFVPLLGGMGVGDLLLGKSPEELEEWAYGNAPMRVPEMTNVPMIKQGRKEQLADTLFLGADVVGLAKGAGVAGRAGVKGAMAMGRAGERLAEKTVPQIMEKGGTMAELLQALSQGSRSQLTAYHGTPHTVDKFDPKKIGSGEGAQAYGYGFYFAESKDVANQYRINLSYNPDEMKIGGKQINEVYKAIERGAARMPPARAQAEYEKLEVLERLMMNEMPADLADFVADLAPGTQQWFNKTVKPSFQTYGNLYTVDIPDEMVSKMLDFEAPFNKQPKSVQEAIKVSGILKDYKANMSDFSSPMMTRNKNMRGENIMQFLEFKLGGPEQVAARLQELGIPGVRYLDAGSRDSGKGTRNIVAFPGGEDQIKILKQEGKK